MAILGRKRRTSRRGPGPRRSGCRGSSWRRRSARSDCGLSTVSCRRSPGRRSSRLRCGRSTSASEQAFPPRGHRLGLAPRRDPAGRPGVDRPARLRCVEVAHESGSPRPLYRELRHTGLPTPAWLAHFPGLGYPLAEWWRGQSERPADHAKALGAFTRHVPAVSARAIGVEVVHRLVIFLFTLLTLFFLFRDGEACAASCCCSATACSARAASGSRATWSRRCMATVTGLVLVGLAEGVPSRLRLCRGRTAACGAGRGVDRRARGHPVRRAGRVLRRRVLSLGDGYTGAAPSGSSPSAFWSSSSPIISCARF